MGMFSLFRSDRPRFMSAAYLTLVSSYLVLFQGIVLGQEVGHNSSTESSVQGLLFEMPVEIFDEEDIALTGAIIPANPVAPGQGPLVDNLGEQWDEQRTNDHLPFWYARSLSGSWIPKNGMDGFGNTDVPITTSFAPIWFDEVPAFLITPGFGFHFWEAPDALELPSRVFDSYIEVTWRTPVTDRWGFAFGMTPGVYGDYEQFNSKAFQLTGWGLLELNLSKKWTLLAGAAVVRQLDMQVLPVGGLLWTPNDNARLELLVPRSRLALKIQESSSGGSLWAYTACQFGGGTWAIALPDSSTAVVTVSDLRAVLGFEWFRSQMTATVAEIGYVFARTISANGTPEFNPSDSLMLQLGTVF